MPSICLAMIMRNESKVLPRSMKSFLALRETGCEVSYAIADGGSDDNSVALVKEIMAEVPGVVEVIPQPQPLDDFSTFRNKSLDMARKLGDWLLMLDADDEIVIEPGFKMPDLDQTDMDGFAVLIKFGGDEFWRPVILRGNRPWHYEDRIHEHLECAGARPLPKLTGLHILIHAGEGARSANAKQKFLNDAEVLKKVLREKPNDPRTTFYLAQSLRDAGELQESMRWYEVRGNMMSAWDEETYFSMLQVARIKACLGAPLPEVQDAYLRAFNFRPTRIEALGYLAEYLRHSKHYNSAVFYAHLAMQIPMPGDVLFVGSEWHYWRAEDEFAVSCFYVGDARTSYNTCANLVSNPRLPREHMDRILTNMRYAKEAMEVIRNMDPSHYLPTPTPSTAREKEIIAKVRAILGKPHHSEPAGNQDGKKIVVSDESDDSLQRVCRV